MVCNSKPSKKVRNNANVLLVRLLINLLSPSLLFCWTSLWRLWSIGYYYFYLLGKFFPQMFHISDLAIISSRNQVLSLKTSYFIPTWLEYFWSIRWILTCTPLKQFPLKAFIYISHQGSHFCFSLKEQVYLTLKEWLFFFIRNINITISILKEQVLTFQT